MPEELNRRRLEALREAYTQKFASEKKIFSNVHAGDRIFIGTGCGEPQYLVKAFIDYVESYPKAFFDAEILHLWTVGVAPYTHEKYRDNFRLNAFFIGSNTREAVNQGAADYTPISLSEVPELFRRKLVPVDVVLIQTSLPDDHHYLSLGINVDLAKVAIEEADLVIAQINSFMPRVHGEAFLHVSEVDYFIHHDEPLLEYEASPPGEVTDRIGYYVSRIIKDGDTIQVGYGSIPNAILANLENKKHLGVHTEFLGHGIIELMKKGVVDNSNKSLNRGKTVAAFCVGKKEDYDYLHDNPAIEFRAIDYTNSPLNIARLHNIVAINSALEIDLTGQATAESLGKTFYSGIGGQADFMRGAVLAPEGKTILALQSTARGGETSRIVPFLTEGAGVTLTRTDIYYVVTEFGIAFLHGKNIRERAMSLIAIAHPRFQPWLLEEAKKLNLIYRDQPYIPGQSGRYPEELEARRTTKSGLPILLRPVRIDDEPLLKDFFYALSNESKYYRYHSIRRDVPHEALLDQVVIDYSKEMVILAVLEHPEREEVVGLGQYGMNPDTLTADVGVVVRDDYQNMGLGEELLSHLTYIAKKNGLVGFTGEAVPENRAIIHLLQKMGFEMEKKLEAGTYELVMKFRGM